MKILVVEDDPNLGFMLEDQLEDENYDVTRCTDGEQGLKAFKLDKFDLCIVDVMMPKMDGFELVKEIRTTDQQTPIIFVTAKSMKEDKLKGFKIGADDYLTKPFSMDELLLRIQAILRRTTGHQVFESSHFQLGKFAFNADERKLIFNDTIQKLTTRENEILKIFCEHINQTITRENILLPIWGDDSYHNGRSLDVFITKLRKYLSCDESLELMSVHGTGYKLFNRSL